MLSAKSVLPIGAVAKDNAARQQATLAQITAICQAVATPDLPDPNRYQPTFPQLFFFTLVYIAKAMKKQQGAATQVGFDWRQPAPVFDFAPQVIQTMAATVATHLSQWGAVVALLQARSAQEWELLRIQMEGATNRFAYPQEIKDASLSDALLKIFQVVTAMPSPDALQSSGDPFAFFVEQQTAMMSLYDFHSPFYAYAHLVARNALFYTNRRQREEPTYPFAWDELTVEPATEDHYDFEAEDAAEEAAAKARQAAEERLQLHLDLARLFTFMTTEMQRQKRRRLVVWHTLAARSQYWLALALTGVPPPVTLPPTPHAGDGEIAKALAMSENAVRAHRNQAKCQIERTDGACSALLAILMDFDLSNKLQWWPPQLMSPLLPHNDQE